jgi:hypothetical protein
MFDFVRDVISHKSQVVFIHGPKTGGTYVCQHESGGEKVISPIEDIGHSFIIDNVGELNPFYAFHDNERATKIVTERERIKNKVIFSIVRNHFDWLVSYFYHAGGDKNNKYYNPEHYDHDIAQKGFEYFIKKICEREDIWPNNKPIFRQAFSSNGDFICDYVARTHSLDDDLELFSNKYKLLYIKRNKQRVGRKESDDYRRYYSDELVDLINSTWSDEMELYGFSFNENHSGIIDRFVNKKEKKSIKYDILKNKILKI